MAIVVSSLDRMIVLKATGTHASFTPYKFYNANQLQSCKILCVKENGQKSIQILVMMQGKPEVNELLDMLASSCQQSSLTCGFPNVVTKIVVHEICGMHWALVKNLCQLSLNLSLSVIIVTLCLSSRTDYHILFNRQPDNCFRRLDFVELSGEHRSNDFPQLHVVLQRTTGLSKLFYFKGQLANNFNLLLGILHYQYIVCVQCKSKAFYITKVTEKRRCQRREKPNLVCSVQGLLLNALPFTWRHGRYKQEPTTENVNMVFPAIALNVVNLSLFSKINFNCRN